MSSRPNPGDTQVINLEDVDVSLEAAAASAEAAAEGAAHRSSRLPPPLPPSASIVPSEPIRPSATPPLVGTSTAPPPARSPIFYVLIIAGVLVASIAAATIVMVRARKPAPAPATASSQPRVITIPVVDMDDQPDGGP